MRNVDVHMLETLVQFCWKHWCSSAISPPDGAALLSQSEQWHTERQCACILILTVTGAVRDFICVFQTNKQTNRLLASWNSLRTGTSARPARTSQEAPVCAEESLNTVWSATSSKLASSDLFRHSQYRKCSHRWRYLTLQSRSFQNKALPLRSDINKIKLSAALKNELKGLIWTLWCKYSAVFI